MYRNRNSRALFERQLYWLHDVGELLAHYRVLDWETLRARAARYELGLPLRQVLGELAAGWGVAVPAAVLDRLCAYRPSRMEVCFYGRRAGALSVGAQLWIRAACLDGWRERLHYWWASAFPSRAYMRARYGARSPLLLPCDYARRILAERHRAH